MKIHSHFQLCRLAGACSLVMAGAVLSIPVHAQGQTQAPGAAASLKSTKPTTPAIFAPTAAEKDIVLDSAPTNPAATTPVAGRLVPTPGVKPPSGATPARRFTAAAHDTATAGSLAELGLNLLRQQSSATGHAQVNAVVSPLSLVSALGMVHAGTTGAGASELAAMLDTTAVGERIYKARMPVLLDRLAKPGGAGSPFVMANRVWLDASVVAAIPPNYATTVADRFNADAAVVPFTQATESRKTINSWVAQKTAKRIPELLPDGSITPNTKLVVTNAIHFKSKWEEPFDPAATVPKPFHAIPGGPEKQVPTMVDERQVRLGTVDNIMVMELPFAGDEFSLMVGVPPAGHTLDALEKDLEGLDIASWGSQLKPTKCRLQLPKFSIDPASKPLKESLQAMGVKTVFGTDANFTPMLGQAAKGVFLDNVYQSATIIIDEQGGEAAAATGATATSKSFSLPAPSCAVDRPFIFAIVHRATGAPLFIGKIADPTLH